MLDTIAAISTSPGIGAISIVRVSGKDSFNIVSKIFKGKKDIRKIKRRDIVYGWIVDKNGNPIDEVLLFLMRGPHTYTGEDTVEISTHGGYIPAKKVLERVLEEGARLAEKGEFTKRAYFSGRIDLIKAESVNDIVRAKTEKSLLIAENNLKGALSKKINRIKEQLIEIISNIELFLDFYDEDVPDIDLKKIEKSLISLKNELLSLKETYNVSRSLWEGIDVVIIGRPNVGKSSIFNALLNEEKAIVTPIPGTTRDIIEGWIEINGFPVRLLDTAGIRETKNEVEIIGVDRTLKKIKESDFKIIVIDGSYGLTDSDKKLISRYRDGIIVINKIDLGIKDEIKDVFKEGIFVSALRFEGIDKIYEELKKRIDENFPVHYGEVYVTRERDINSINKAIEFIMNGLRQLKEGSNLEIVAFELNQGVNALRELIGEITSEDILNKIFNDFCIGK